jgi:hypothetical protein
MLYPGSFFPGNRIVHTNVLRSALTSIILLGLCASSAQVPGEQGAGFHGRYLGQALPGCKPEAFAARLFSPWNDYGFHLRSSVFFTADNTTLFFTNGTLPAVTGHDCSIWSMRRRGLSWTEPEIVSFSGDYYDKIVFLSNDGETMHFVSTRPDKGRGAAQDFNIWFVRENGRKGAKPERFGYPVNSIYDDLGGVMTTDGVMYLLHKAG